VRGSTDDLLLSHSLRSDRQTAPEKVPPGRKARLAALRDADRSRNASSFPQVSKHLVLCCFSGVFSCLCSRGCALHMFLFLLAPNASSLWQVKTETAERSTRNRDREGDRDSSSAGKDSRVSVGNDNVRASVPRDDARSEERRWCCVLCGCTSVNAEGALCLLCWSEYVDTLVPHRQPQTAGS
jgi:hypothetical protein